MLSLLFYAGPILLYQSFHRAGLNAYWTNILILVTSIYYLRDISWIVGSTYTLCIWATTFKEMFYFVNENKSTMRFNNCSVNGQFFVFIEGFWWGERKQKMPLFNRLKIMITITFACPHIYTSQTNSRRTVALWLYHFGRKSYIH